MTSEDHAFFNLEADKLLELFGLTLNIFCSRDGLWTDTGLDLLVSDKSVAAAACALTRPLLFLLLRGRGLES